MNASLHLAAFELRRAAARGAAALALLLFTGALAIGHLDHWLGKATSSGSTFFGYAYLIGLVLLMRFGLAADRTLRFDEYLIANHVRPRDYVLSKVGAMAALLAGYAVFGACVEAAFTGGDVADAAWSGVAWTLVAWMFAPLAMTVEAWLDTSVPAALVLLVYVVAVMAEFMSAGTLRTLEVLGVRQLAPGDWATLGPLALRSLVGGALGFAVVGVLVALRSRRYSPACPARRSPF